MNYSPKSKNSDNNKKMVTLPPISFLSKSKPEGVSNQSTSTATSDTNTGNSIKLPSLSSIASYITQPIARQNQSSHNGSVQLPTFKFPSPESKHRRGSSTSSGHKSNKSSESGSNKRRKSQSESHHYHHRHPSDDLGEKIREAQSQLKDGGHIHIVHEPHGDHHHHKVYVHNPPPKEKKNIQIEPVDQDQYIVSNSNNNNNNTTTPNASTSTIQNDSTIGDNSTLNQTTIFDQSTLASQPFHKRRVTVKSRKLLQQVSEFPRENICSVVYDEYPTASTIIRSYQHVKQDDISNEDSILQKSRESNNERKKLYGLYSSKRIELLPSFIVSYLNCTVDILVPYSALFNNANVYDKRIWGTDIYTDDSDVVAILYHCGILHSQDPTKRKSRKLSRRQQRKERQDSSFDEHSGILEFTNYTGAITPGNIDNIHNVGGDPVTEEDAADLIVTLIILPTLKEYKGCYRNNYYSRSWKKHDGCSIALYGVRWCQLGEGIFYSGMAHYGSFRKRILSERQEVTERARTNEFEDIEKKQIKEKNNERTNDKGQVETIGRWVADCRYWKQQ